MNNLDTTLIGTALLANKWLMLECKTYNFRILHFLGVCLTYLDNLVLLPFEKYHTKRITSHSLTLVWDLSYSCQTTLSYYFCLTTFWKISYKLSSRKACKVRQSTRLTKKLMLSRVQVKRIKSDIPACNFNRNSRLHCRWARVWRSAAE